MLKDSYFRIIDRSCEGNNHQFTITLLSDHPIYNGHFPGNPISPGVCSIQMIRECCEEILESKVALKSISQCRFITLLTPDKGERLTIDIALTEAEDNVKITAAIADGNSQYVSFKGEVQKK